MEVNSQIEKSCTALASLFHQVISDMKSSAPVWEEFIMKAAKLHTALRSTVAAATSFLEAFQKLADMATNTRGATKDIGSALTRLCLRHRSIEGKLKTVTSAVMDTMVMPLQEKTEDWKKVIAQLERDRNRDTKKAHQEIKKALSETQKLQKKLKKGKSAFQKPLEVSIKDLNEKLMMLKENEKSAVRAVLTEERSRYCLLIQCIKPFMDGEISLLGDVTHLQEIMDSLSRQAVDPLTLPETSEQLVTDICDSSSSWICQIAPPSDSPTQSVSSSKSSLSSLSSSSNSSSLSPPHSYQPKINSESFTDSPNEKSSSEHYAMMKSSDSGHWPLSPPLRISRQREICDDRPHTISSVYERSHSRSALCPQTFQPLSSQGSSVPTTPNPHITSMRPSRIRPHSLVRNIELAELLDRRDALLRRQNETCMTSSVDSSTRGRMQNMQPYASIISAGDLMQGCQNLSGGKNIHEGHVMLRRCHDKALDNVTWKGQKIVSISEHPLFVHPEKDDTKADGAQMSAKARSIQHSMSCNVIGNEPHRAIDDISYTSANGNTYEHIYEEVPRHSSMLIADRQSTMSRHLSLISRDGSLNEVHNGQADISQDQRRISLTHSRLVNEMISSSGQPCHAPKEGSEGILLPPSPFRSPDNFEDQDYQLLGHAAHKTCYNEQVSQSFGGKSEDMSKRMCAHVWKTGGTERQMYTTDREYFDDRLRNPWQGMSGLMMPSPDDTTPTNENQPGIFTDSQNSQLSPAPPMKNIDSMDSGPARESSI